MADKNIENKDEEILRIAKERFALAEEAWSEVRRLALEDLKFISGEQWPDDVKNARSADARPCLTINRIPQFIRQITNDQRQNRPSIKVFPVDDKGDQDIAKIMQGLIRHIEYNSGADTAYDEAFKGAVGSSFGYFRIITDYVSPESFEQEILIKKISNHFSVYLDPHHKEPDGSDAEWGFVFEDVSKDSFEAKYPKAKLSSENDWRSLGDSTPGWISDKTCRIAEYFYKEYEEKTIYLLNTGEVLSEDDLPETLPNGVEIKNKRQAVLPVIKWCKIVGNEILERTDWLGQWIPIIPVYGDELNIDGKRVLEGIVRHAKDPQRMYNYWASTETETIALAPRAPFIGAEGQFEGHEGKWQTANSKPHAYLEYKPVDLNGQLSPPPQRNVYEAPVQSITSARLQSSEDLKATTGIYDAALGARSNEVSGVAIRGRQAQAQTSNFHFIDNLTRSLRHAGRILVDLIPKVYDYATAARIIGEDGEQQIVYINQVMDGVIKNDLSAGKYDVTVETGPGFATKRQEAVASILEFIGAYPQAAQVIGDLLAKNMDWPGAQEISERLKKLIPPHILGDGNQQLPPEAQAQMAQMQQMIQMLQGQLQQATLKLETKAMELESKERVEFAKMDVDLKKEMMKVPSEQSLAALMQEMAEINARLEMVGISRPIAPNQNFNGPGPDQTVMPNYEQQPTGGISPGQYVGE